MKRITNKLLILLGMAVLTACGGGGDSASIAGGGRGGDSIGFLTLSITDAPIDSATEVWVQVDGVTLKHEASAPATIALKPAKTINLLTLQGQNSMQLFENEAVQSGNYNWIELKITAVKDGVLDSYVKLKDGTVHELDMPTGSEIGLKIIDGLRIVANMPSKMTVDFDLRKSIMNNSPGIFTLAPVLDLVQDDLTGSIRGTVKLKTLTDPKDCSDTLPDTYNSVYLFEGFNVKPDDVDGIDPDPKRSANVTLNNATGQYEYEFGFVPFGKYTVAFTCQTDLDDPATDDAIVFSKKAKNVQIANTDPKTIPGNTFR